MSRAAGVVIVHSTVARQGLRQCVARERRSRLAVLKECFLVMMGGRGWDVAKFVVDGDQRLQAGTIAAADGLWEAG